jgi:peptidoglycan hydrolase-like protein with peptidoglycan-binding domain
MATSLGVDIANMDGNRCDWVKARAAGVRYAYLRDCFSTADDRTYELEAPRCRAAGVKPGPYFFPDQRVNAVPMATQIASFAVNVRRYEQAGDLPAAFDVEFSQGTRGTGRTRVQLLALVVSIAEGLRAALGYWPVLYSSKRVIDGEDTDALDADGQTEVDLSPLKNCPFWASRYIANYHVAPVLQGLDSLPLPPIPKYLGDAGNVWIRQTQGDSIGMPGFTRTVDIDIFYPMRLGEKGERVKWVQRRVGASADGTFGAQTDIAVREFQRSQHLDADGIIGIDTWSRLAKRP